MRISLGLLGSVGLVAACGGADLGSRTPQSSSKQPPAAERFVLLSAAASLYQSAGDSQPLVDYSYREAARQWPHATRVLRLVGEHGEWLEVESQTPALFSDVGNHCQRVGVLSLRGAHVRFFVKRADVVPVVNKAMQVSFKDGTRVALKPGVAMSPQKRSDGREYHWLRVSGLETVLPVGRSSVGWFYTPAEPFARSNSHSLPRLRRAAFTDKAVRVGGLLLGPTIKPRSNYVFPLMSPAVYFSQDAPSGQSLVELRGDCVTVRALVAKKYVATGKQAGIFGGFGGLTGGVVQQFPAARADSAIYWRDGQPAGRVVSHLDFHDETKGADNRRCFRLVSRSRWIPNKPAPKPDEIVLEAPGHSDPTHFLTVCFDRDAIQDSAPSSD